MHTYSGYFSRTRLRCSFTVVKTLLYCTRKWSCNLSCTSALSRLQLPCNGSTGQVPLPEHEIGIRKFCVLGGGPDQLNRCKDSAAGSMLTCSSNCSFIPWYNTIGFLPPWSCTWVAFWKNSHIHHTYTCKLTFIHIQQHIAVAVIHTHANIHHTYTRIRSYTAPHSNHTLQNFPFKNSVNM